MEPTHKNRTHFFTLRLWEERVTGEKNEIRFKVQHVLSGEVRYFRDWPTLIRYLISIVQTETDAP
jgi:hypothetical protein